MYHGKWIAKYIVQLKAHVIGKWIAKYIVQVKASIMKIGLFNTSAGESTCHGK